MSCDQQDNKTISASLRSAWLRQLNKAHNTILWGHKIKTPPISLALMKSDRTWGRWDEKKRCISISETLIYNHPWNAVLGILGHELAHQLVTDIAGGSPGETPHGLTFRSMALSIGLDPFYMRAGIDLAEQCPQPWPDADHPLNDEKTSLLNKVKKLLALSGSPVEAEAQAAMNAAAQIMARHNIEMLEQDGCDSGYERRLIKLGGTRIQARQAGIASILNRHFFVETIFVPGYNALTDNEEKNLELLGRPENTRLAEHVFHFLMERSESLWKRHQRSRRHGGGLIARNSFINGLLEGFDQKLSAAVSEGSFFDNEQFVEGFSALVLRHDQGLNDFVKTCHPRLRAVRSSMRYFCPDSERAGRAAGRALNFNRPLENDKRDNSGCLMIGE